MFDSISKKRIIILLATSVFIVSYFFNGIPSIVFFTDGLGAKLLVFIENLVNCGENTCLTIDVIFVSLLNAVITIIILSIVFRKCKKLTKEK